MNPVWLWEERFPPATMAKVRGSPAKVHPGGEGMEEGWRKQTQSLFPQPPPPFPVPPPMGQMHGMSKVKGAYVVPSVEVSHSMQSREGWRIDVEQRIACPFYCRENNSICTASGRDTQHGFSRNPCRSASLC